MIWSWVPAQTKQALAFGRAVVAPKRHDVTAPQREQRQVCHLHIQKCGGTAVNAWLDLNAPSERTGDPAAVLIANGLKVTADSYRRDDRGEQQRGRALLTRDFDVLHGHFDPTPLIRQDAYVFTILRDPVARILSQFRDFHRLQAHDYEQKGALAIAVHEACRQAKSFSDVATKCGKIPVFRKVFEDKLCRALTGAELSPKQFQALSPEERASAAWSKIEARCNRVGFQDDIETLLNQIAADLGWAPVRSLAAHNVTQNGTSDDQQDIEAAERLSQADRILYARALERRRGARPFSYTAADFERLHAAGRLGALAGRRAGRETVFDINMPVIGWGLVGRERPSSPDCTTWMATEGSAALYVPGPGRGASVRLRLYVKGWGSPSLRAAAKFSIDDEPATASCEAGADGVEIVTLRRTMRRPWVKISVSCPTEISGRSASQRGLLNLWRYSLEVD